MELSTLDRFRKAEDQLRHSRGMLGHLARAFSSTGNQVAADRLYEIADTIESAQSEIDAGVHEAIGSAMTDAVQASTNMIVTAMAMIDRGATKS